MNTQAKLQLLRETESVLLSNPKPGDDVILQALRQKKLALELHMQNAKLIIPGVMRQVDWAGF